MRYEIRELGVGGILDQAIQLVKNHFGLLFLITLVAYVPLTAIIAYVNASMPKFQLGGNQEEFAAAVAAAQSQQRIIYPLLGLGMFIIYPLTNAAIIHAVASVYLGRTTSLGDAFSRAVRVLLPLAWTSILYYLSCALGLIVLIVGILIPMFYFALSTHVVVIEGVWGISALRRSARLMKGNIGTVVVLGLMLFVINFAAGFLTAIISQVYIATAVSVIIQTALFIFVTTAMVVFYFSCRSKAENFDLTMLAEAIEAEEPTAQPTRA